MLSAISEAPRSALGSTEELNKGSHGAACPTGSTEVARGCRQLPGTHSLA